MGGHVLLVEDNEAQRFVMELEMGPMTEARGLRLHVAGTAAEARKALAAIPPGERVLVLSDYHLPDGRGDEIVNSVATREGSKGVLMSATGHDAADVIVKPVDLNDMRIMLERVVAEWA